MKNIYEIDYDGIYSTIEEISPIHSWSGDKIVIDEYNYFSTKAKAKKHLINNLKQRAEELKYAIEHIKKTY